MDYARRVQSRREHLYRLAYCYMKHPQDAMDLVSEAVCRGLVHLHQLREEEHFNAWMDSILVHTALDTLRRESRRPQEAGEELLPLLPAQEAALSAEEGLDLYAALEHLTAEEKTYVLLRFFRGYSFREMSEMLKQPETTVKSRLYRILEKLRRQLTDGEEGT